MDYHTQAQNFIKSSKSKGYSVKAEGSELIAYPPKNATTVFHATVGHNNPTSNLAPTPFQMIGGAVKTAVKGVGRAILNNFVDPSINVSKIKDAKMQDMARRAKSGELNK